ncbi:MFS transporter [Rhodococcus sp. NPDC059968]|uniref:MFS transporter n=1 Tax=Rhodococcus sp. NPDC059968 TaxID=3347017 RepID=UPI00366F56B4
MRILIFIPPTVLGFTSGFWYPLIPAWSDTLHIGAAPLNWLSSISYLALVVTVPIFSALGDRYGHRRLLTLTSWLSAAGIAILAVAPSFAVAAIGMAFWGAQGAWLACLIGLVRDKETGARANRTIALQATGITVGQLIGILTSGASLSLLGNVRLTLAIPAALCVVCALIAMFLIPESTTRTTRPIDWIGAFGLAVGLVSLLLGVMNANSAGWTSTSTVTLAVFGLAVLAAWVKWERHTPTPLINLRVLTSRAMWPAMMAAMMFGVILFVPRTPLLTFLAAKPDSVGYGFGFAATAISVVLICYYLIDTLGSSLYALLASKIGPRVAIVAGISWGTVGLASVAVLAHAGSAAWAITLAFMAIGLGVGILGGSMPAYISAAAPSDQVAIISGTYSTVRGVGGTIGTAVAGALLAASTPAGSTSPSVGGYSAVWFFCAAAALVSLLLMLASWFRRRPPAAVQPGVDGEGAL